MLLDATETAPSRLVTFTDTPTTSGGLNSPTDTAPTAMKYPAVIRNGDLHDPRTKVRRPFGPATVTWKLLPFAAKLETE